MNGIAPPAPAPLWLVAGDPDDGVRFYIAGREVTPSEFTEQMRRKARCKCASCRCGHKES